MLENELQDNEEYYSPLNASEQDNDDESSYDGDYDDFDGEETEDFDGDYDDFDGDETEDFDGEYEDFDGDEIIDCSKCNHSWDLKDSSPNDAYICHLCGNDNSFEDVSSSFDDSVFNMNFSDIRGDYKQSFGRVNRRIDSNPRTIRRRRRRRIIRKPRLSMQGQSRLRKSKRPLRGRMLRRPLRSGMARPMGDGMARPTRGGMAKPMGKTNPSGLAKPLMNPKTKGISKPSSTPSFKSSAGKPLKNKFLKGGLKNNFKKPVNVSLANDKKVIIKGASNFILSQKSQDEGIKGIQYYKGKKLKPLILTINNEDPTDFIFELFNPSMPLDYLYSTSQNLNNRIKVAGGNSSYSDVLFNILANPTMVINVQMVSAGNQVTAQNNQAIFVTNKNIEGIQKIFPVNIDLQVDNMQVANDIIYFNVQKAINRPFIPDGMDIIRYTVLAGMSVTMTFWYTQVSLKKVFYEEAKASKSLL